MSKNIYLQKISYICVNNLSTTNIHEILELDGLCTDNVDEGWC